MVGGQWNVENEVKRGETNHRILFGIAMMLSSIYKLFH